MAMITSIFGRLKLLCHQYYSVSVYWRYTGSVLVILIVMATFVGHQHYWNTIFNGAHSITDWHEWRIFTLVEIVLTIITLLCCLDEECREGASVWTFGWIAVPVVISVCWLLVNTVRSYLDWCFYLSLRREDLIILLFLTVFFMVAARLLLIFLFCLMGVTNMIEGGR
ncbi:hypothetical protein ACU6ZM_23790 [Klebsiella aerogenes]